VSETKSERWLLVQTDESDPQAIMALRQEWLDAATALGELQMWLLGPATQTVSRFTQS